MTAKTDAYFAKPRTWHDAALALRGVLLDMGLTEELKWGKPCYQNDGQNIVIIQEIKNFMALLFFNGSAIDDPEGVLERPGANSHIGRRMRFVSPDEVTGRRAILRDYVTRSIAAHKAGVPVERVQELVYPDELINRFDDDPDFHAAFSGLTPGRQRAYVLHFAGAKQSATRVARIEKFADRIKAGKGLADR